jgi:hypothetical protein
MDTISFNFTVKGGDVPFKFIPRIGRGSQGSRGSARSRQLWWFDRHWLVVNCYSNYYTDPTGKTSGLETQQTISQMEEIYVSRRELLFISFDEGGKNHPYTIKKNITKLPLKVLILIHF